jgi:hypothetical protein
VIDAVVVIRVTVCRVLFVRSQAGLFHVS